MEEKFQVSVKIRRIDVDEDTEIDLVLERETKNYFLFKNKAEDNIIASVSLVIPKE